MLEVLAWRSGYETAGGQVTHVEWFCVTNYGIGHFRVCMSKNMRPTFETLIEQKAFGWLNKVGMNGVQHHMWMNKMRMRCEKLGARVTPMHAASIDALEEKFKLGELFQHDTKAHNAWCNITGIPVGTTFESIVTKAEAVVVEQRETFRVKHVEALIEADASYGMF